MSSGNTQPHRLPSLSTSTSFIDIIAARGKPVTNNIGTAEMAVDIESEEEKAGIKEIREVEEEQEEEKKKKQNAVVEVEEEADSSQNSDPGWPQEKEMVPVQGIMVQKHSN